MTVTLSYIIHGLLGNEALRRRTFILPLPDPLHIAVSRDGSEEEKKRRGGIFHHVMQFEVFCKVKNQRCQVVALSECSLIFANLFVFEI